MAIHETGPGSTSIRGPNILRTAGSGSLASSQQAQIGPIVPGVTSCHHETTEPDAPLTNLFADHGRWSQFWGLKTPCINLSHRFLSRGIDCPIYFMMLGSARGLVSFRPYVSKHETCYGPPLTQDRLTDCPHSGPCEVWEDLVRDLSVSAPQLLHGEYRIKIPWEDTSSHFSSLRHFHSLLMKFHTYSVVDFYDSVQSRCRFVPPAIIIATREQANIYDREGWQGACLKELDRMEKWTPRVNRTPRVNIIDLTESDTPPPEESQGPSSAATARPDASPETPQRKTASAVRECRIGPARETVTSSQHAKPQISSGSSGYIPPMSTENSPLGRAGPKRSWATSEDVAPSIRIGLEASTKRRELEETASPSRRNQLDNKKTARKATPMSKQTKAQSTATATKRRHMSRNKESASSSSAANKWLGNEAGHETSSSDTANARTRDAQTERMDAAAMPTPADNGVETKQAKGMFLVSVLENDNRAPQFEEMNGILVQARRLPDWPQRCELPATPIVHEPLPFASHGLPTHDTASSTTLNQTSSHGRLPEHASEDRATKQLPTTETQRHINGQTIRPSPERTTVARQERTPDSTVLDNEESLPSLPAPDEDSSRASACELHYLDELGGPSAPIEHVILRSTWSHKNPYLDCRTTQAWREAKLREIEVRGGRKKWFGKVVERLHWRRREDEKVRGLARPRGQPLLRSSRFKTMDEMLDLAEDQLPDWIKDVPIRRNLWAFKRQKQLNSPREPKMAEEICPPAPFGFVKLREQLTPAQRKQRARIFAFLRQ